MHSAFLQFDLTRSLQLPVGLLPASHIGPDTSGISQLYITELFLAAGLVLVLLLCEEPRSASLLALNLVLWVLKIIQLCATCT